MNEIKKIVGILMIVLGVLAFVLAPYQAYQEITAAYVKNKQIMDNWVFWIIILLIFEPVMVAFMRFGWFAFQGEYSELVEE